MTLAQVSSSARRHPQLSAGLAVVLLVVAFGPVGSLLVDTDLARVGSAEPDTSPSVEHPLGTDAAGRDLLAVMVAGTPLTLRVGFIAGAVGLGLGIVLGFIAGYFGGLVDTLIKGAADVLLTMPGLLFLVVLATSLHTAVTVDMMALVVASLAWMLPTRTIRSQVLSMRERGYVQVARLSGWGTWRSSPANCSPTCCPIWRPASSARSELPSWLRSVWKLSAWALRMNPPWA